MNTIVSVATRDPHPFGIDLVHEYEMCAREYGFGTTEFGAMNGAALRHSFLPEQVKARIAQDFFPSRNA